MSVGNLNCSALYSRLLTHEKLDYTCGILPVTRVDKSVDQLGDDFDMQKLNGVARGAYEHYNASRMDGLPVGIQVVGQRLQEEKVLAYMNIVEGALAQSSRSYELLSID